MKRLIRKAYRVGSTARFISNPNEKGVCTIIGVSEDGAYNLTCQSGSYNDIGESELVEGDAFIPGDQVIYKNHPYDNKTVFTVTNLLQNGNYYIENADTSYTDINGVNLEFA